MLDETSTPPTKLFACCLKFGPDEDLVSHVGDDDDKYGTFQFLVEALDLEDAVTKCRLRLHETAATTHILDAVAVTAGAFVEVPLAELTRGVIVNHQTWGKVIWHNYIPEHDASAATLHFDDELDGAAEGEAAEPDGGAGDGDRHDDLAAADAAKFEDDERSNVPIIWAKWKLYWCETADHDEDWFVVARSADEAAVFHENAEGYDRGDATAEIVGVLPDSIQIEAEKEGRGWPSKETLLACGAEFIPHTPQDGWNNLRGQVGSGARIVRINGRIYSEGDIVSNTMQRLGAEPDA